jgi:hypothetical protein
MSMLKNLNRFNVVLIVQVSIFGADDSALIQHLFFGDIREFLLGY